MCALINYHIKEAKSVPQRLGKAVLQLGKGGAVTKSVCDSACALVDAHATRASHLSAIYNNPSLRLSAPSAVKKS